jgi:hypothetical protein
MYGPLPDRRNDYDVTNTVRVSSATAVRDEVSRLFRQSFPKAAFDSLWIAFHDFDRLFEGRYPGYLGCDTVYHDIQHTLDMTLAMGRLLAGYEQIAEPEDRLGDERATLGLITALFHDAGYIRRTDEPRWANGAEFTNWHVSRSADFLRDYLPQLGLDSMVNVATQVVHFTGYEMSLNDIELDDPRDTIVGHLLGTADLLAQMADRCYLEKCRDRLYAEFVIGGVALGATAKSVPLYDSGRDLLRKTPGFWQEAALKRMSRQFNRAYRYVEPLYGGHNPYMDFINANLGYLNEVIQADDWQRLRRQPPCFTVGTDTLDEVSAMVSHKLAEHDLPASQERLQ